MTEKKPKVKYEVEYIRDLSQKPIPQKKTFLSKNQAEKYCEQIEKQAGLCVLNKLVGKKRMWEFRK